MKIGDGSSGDPTEIAAIVETLRNAGRGTERGDANAVVAMFDLEEEPMLFDFLAPGVTTVADIRRNVEAFAGGDAGVIVNHYPYVTVRILSDDLAYSLAYGVVQSDGDPRIDVHMSVTDIWRKRDGRWRAIHEHSSLPVDLATGRSIMRQPLPGEPTAAKGV